MSQTTSWNVILSPPWVQERMWIPMGPNGCPWMQCIKLRTKGWGRLNLVYNTKEKKHFKAHKNMG